MTTTQPTSKSITWSERLMRYAGRLFVFFLVLLVLLVVALYFIMGTRAGSQLILERIAAEANTTLSYDGGNLRDGAKLSNIKIAQGEDVAIDINKAYVQMGFRAIFAKQIHIVHADIDAITINNKKPPTGEPFDYPAISLPVTLVLENTAINQVRYEQATRSPVVLSDIYLAKASWQNDKVQLKDGHIQIDDTVAVSDITGDIRLTGDYPLAARAVVKVAALDNHYVEPLTIDAKGTLKRTTGTLTGLYNQAAVTGQFIAQGLDDGSPFWAQLNFDKLNIPYANDQNIVLTDGMLQATGVVSAIDLRINTHLDAKDIPSGHYQGRAKLNGDGMVIERLTANTDNGTLVATGQMSWRDDFYLTSEIASQDFKLQEAVPDDYENYREYLPKQLDGWLGFDFWVNDNSKTRYVVDLNQRNGERMYADISQDNSDNAPWQINANWQNLQRSQLSTLGNINSPKGQAQVIAHNNRTDVTANADIVTLSALPQGNYDVRVNIADDTVKLEQATYLGVMGDLHADGVIYLANDERDLSYRIKATTDKLMVNAYFDKNNETPIDYLSGQTLIVGKLISGGQDVADVHDISLTQSDLTAVLGSQSVQLVGDAKAVLKMRDNLQHFTAQIDGRLITKGINDGLADNALVLTAFGDSQKITIDKLNLSGAAGSIAATGTLNLSNGVAWNIKADADKLDTTKFHPKSQAVLTGQFVSAGLYRKQLVAADASFEGQLSSDTLPTGQVLLDVSAAGSKATINRLSYQGQAGTLHAAGWMDAAKGIVADINASMQDFDLGYFVKDYSSQLTGQVQAYIDWQADGQHLDINTLDIKGMVNDEAVLATGSARVVLDMPDDFRAYMRTLQSGGFDLDSLLDRQDSLYDSLANLGMQAGQLQSSLGEQDKQIRHLIKVLDVKQMQLIFGDNRFNMDGNQSRLAVDIDAQALSQILPTVRGQVVGTAVLISDNQSLPTIYTDLSLNGISMPSFALREGSVIARVVNLGNSDSAAVVQAVGVVAAGRSLRQVRFDVNGTVQRHNLSLFVNDGNMVAQSRVQGGFDGRIYKGVVSEGRLQTRYGALNQRQPAEMSYDVNAAALAIASHCWQTLSANISSDGSRGSLCLMDTLRMDKNQGKVDVVVQNLDMTVLTPILPSDLSLRGRLSGKVQAVWGALSPQGKPTVHAVLYSDDGQVGLRNEGLPDTTMSYERVSLIAQTVPTGLKLRADIKAGQAGDGYVDVIVNPEGEDKPIAGALVLNRLNLGVLRPFLPAFRLLEGEVNIAGGVGGTLKNPQFFGNAALSEGKLALTDAPLALDDISLDAQVRGTNANLSGSFSGGEGTGSLSGVIDWSRELQARLSVAAQNLDISNPPLLSAAVDPHLEIVVRPSQKYVDIKGVVAVPVATIRPPEATEAVVGESGDVVVIDRRMTGRVEDILAQVEPWSINADIGLDLGDEVVFRGFGANLPLAGALHLTQAGQGSMQARGVIQVSERTSVDIIGQSLDLNYGQIRFNGSLTNPRLSIEAVREIEGQTIGLRITDTLASPDIHVFNNAGLSDEQAMNALATGRLSDAGATQISEQGFRSQVTNSLAAAGLSLGLQGTHSLTNEIGRAIGLESLVVDASGAGDDTNVNLTGYISPDLYIRYGVGIFNAKSSLSMRYRLTRRIYLEATRATETIVDVVYRVRF